MTNILTTNTLNTLNRTTRVPAPIERRSLDTLAASLRPDTGLAASLGATPVPAHLLGAMVVFGD